MQFARWSILSKWGNLRNLICRSKNRFCSLEISTSLCCLTSVQTSAFRTKVVMCIAKEIRLTLIAKVFMAQELTQGTYDLLFAVQALNAAVEMWNCERCFLKGYGILSRFRKPENSFLYPLLQLWVDVVPSVRRSLCFTVELRDISVIWINRFKKNYPYHIIGEFPIMVYFLSLLISRFNKKGIDRKRIWKSILENKDERI